MNLLLDTHTTLWFLRNDPKLSRPARDAIANASVEVFVSAVTAWEIATKYRLGKLPAAAGIAHDIEGSIAGVEFLPLAVSLAHGQLAGALPGVHKDPFDRLLAAQAIAENLTLVSNETVLDQFGVRRLW